MMIRFLHLVILTLLVEHQQKPPRQVDMLGEGGLVNTWLAERSISRHYTDRLTSRHVFLDAIDALRDAKLLKSSKRYIPTQKGVEFVRLLSPDWRNWPLQIPIVNHSPDLENAKFLEDMYGK